MSDFVVSKAVVEGMLYEARREAAGGGKSQGGRYERVEKVGGGEVVRTEQ